VQKCVETPLFLGTHFRAFGTFANSPSFGHTYRLIYETNSLFRSGSPDVSQETFQTIQVASRAGKAGEFI
jgi:hypothetical protein